MLIDLLEMAGNNALQYDPRAREHLEKLQGKTMSLVIKPLGSYAVQQISFSPGQHGIELSAASDIKPDVTLTATLRALIKISRDGLDDAELDSGELEINGDPIIGQRFARVLADLDVDWEALLAEHLGETPAVLIGTGLGKAKQVAESSREGIKTQLNKLLIVELEIVADKQSVETFLDEVDKLRADSERLLARIQRLQNTS